MADNSQFFDDDFKAAVVLAGAQARLETLRAGIPVFYRDAKYDVHIMEHPDGRKFEIRFIAGASGDQNYEILRQLEDAAA